MSKHSSTPELLSLTSSPESAAPSTRVMAQLADAMEHSKRVVDSQLISHIFQQAMTPADPLKTIDWSQADRKHRLLGVGDERKEEKPKAPHVVAEVKPANSDLYLTGAEVAFCVSLAVGAIAKDRKPESTSDAASMPAKTDRQSHADGVRAAAQPHKLARRTYKMPAHDTLVSLAMRLYGDETVAHLIADINCMRTAETIADGRRIIQLKEGQRILLPTEQELDLFYQRADSRRKMPVVSIVSSRQSGPNAASLLLGRALGLAAGTTASTCTIAQNLLHSYLYTNSPNSANVLTVAPPHPS